MPGPVSFPKLLCRASPTCHCAKTTWLFSSCSGKDHGYSQVYAGGAKRTWKKRVVLIMLFILWHLDSEEIFDYSAEQMTQVKTKNLKNSMCGEFSEIFQLCSEVLQKANKPSLIKATLNTLLRFLNWIPLGYIFETGIVETLRSRVSREFVYYLMDACGENEVQMANLAFLGMK